MKKIKAQWLDGTTLEAEILGYHVGWPFMFATLKGQEPERHAQLDLTHPELGWCFPFYPPQKRGTMENGLLVV